MNGNDDSSMLIREFSAYVQTNLKPYQCDDAAGCVPKSAGEAASNCCFSAGPTKRQMTNEHRKSHKMKNMRSIDVCYVYSMYVYIYIHVYTQMFYKVFIVYTL